MSVFVIFEGIVTQFAKLHVYLLKFRKEIRGRMGMAQRTKTTNALYKTCAGALVAD
jgi:hypothetical protein